MIECTYGNVFSLGALFDGSVVDLSTIAFENPLMKLSDVHLNSSSSYR
jgi:hypothetical protein